MNYDDDGFGDYDVLDFEDYDAGIEDAGELARSIQNEHDGEPNDRQPWPGTQAHRDMLRRTYGGRVPLRHVRIKE